MADRSSNGSSLDDNFNQSFPRVTRVSNFGAETLRRPREHFHNMLRELQPLVNRPEITQASAHNLASWLSPDSSPHSEAVTRRHPEPDNVSPEDAIIINMMDSIEQTETTENSGQSEVPIAEPQNNRTRREDAQQNLTSQAELLRSNSELRALLSVAEKYLGLALIMIFKVVFDHKIGILVILGLAITFFHANAAMKREVAKQHKRYLGSLLAVTLNLLICMFFIYYVFEDKQFQFAILLIPVCSKQLEVMELLWIVVVTDFILKFITILLKICILVFPAKLIPFQKKGKFYLFLERTSQLYRLLAPVQPWLCYLTESYEGHEKIFSVLLSVGYIISKASPLVKNMKSWKTAFCKLLQPVIYGSKPSSEQLKTAGDSCPICQDAFKNPTILHCKHLFCEECVAAWFDRERTCPMCRAEVADDPTWRDGTTSLVPQFF